MYYLFRKIYSIEFEWAKYVRIIFGMLDLNLLNIFIHTYNTNTMYVRITYIQRTFFDQISVRILHTYMKARGGVLSQKGLD